MNIINLKIVLILPLELVIPWSQWKCIIWKSKNTQYLNNSRSDFLIFKTLQPLFSKFLEPLSEKDLFLI